MSAQWIGPYELAERIGAGGMGEVFRAWDSRLERWVAIKTILASKELSPERRERLRREARAVASLSHPAVTQVFDIVLDHDRDHVVMELVQGRSLASWLEPGALAPEVAVEIARQIAAGLAAAHAKGIVHRDLKAENIIVADDLRVKILDFGLAKRILDDRDDTLTHEGVVMGTSRAMSPEQAEGKSIDHRSDLFALGSLLYQMLTGSHPFAVASNMETMRRVVYHTPKPVLELAPGVPLALAGLTDALLAKDPGDRPRHADDVVRVLDEIAHEWATGSGSRVSSARLTQTYAHRAAPRRQRRWLVGGAVVLVGVITASALWMSRRPTPPVAVAIMAPVVAADAVADVADRARQAVQMAAVETVASLSGLAAIDPLELRNAGTTVREVATAVAADEVVVASISGCSSACRITLRRVDPSGAVLWSSALFEVPGDDLQLMARAVAAKLRDAWPDRQPRRETIIPNVDPELFARFLEIRQLRDSASPGVTRDDLLARLEQIRQAAPDFLEVHLEEADLARYRFEASSDPRYLERARAALDRAKRLAPDDPRLIDQAVSLAIAANDLATARRELARLEDVVPGDSRTLELRGDVLHASGDAAGAVKLFRRLVAARPSARNLYAAAEAELYVGNVAAASELLRRGLERAPSTPFLLAKLAQLELMSGEPGHADALLSRLVEITPSSIAWVNLGTARFLLRDYQGALEAYRRSYELDPEVATTSLNLGECYKVIGDEGNARTWFERALAAAAPGRAAGDEEAVGVAALALAHLGRVREAANAIQEEQRLAPDAIATQYDAAVVHALLGEEASAMSAAEQALQGGMHPIWFSLPWFDRLREEPDFAAALAPG